MPGALAVLSSCVAAGLVLVLGACESSESPPVTASPSASATAGSSSPSPSVTASPSPSASSAVPAAAREKSEKGAEAFVRYFFDQVNVAWMEAAPARIEDSSDGGCKSCAALTKTATELREKKHHYATEPIGVGKVSATPGAPQGQQYVQADLIQNQVDILSESGSVVGTDKKTNFQRTVALIWAGDRWLVYDLA